MRSWFGYWNVSMQADSMEVTVLATEKDITLGYRLNDGTVQTRKWPIGDLHVSFDKSLQSTRIVNVNQSNGTVIIAGNDALKFIEQVQAERQKPWHRQQGTKDRIRLMTIVTGVIAILVTVYFLLVPWLSEKMAATISPETEEKFGNAVYNALSLSTQEEKEASILLNSFFHVMNVDTKYNIRITAVKSETVNAFALPGGNIVVYTGLLKKLQHYPELAALLSHEFTHVNNKHSTKSIFRQLGSRIFLGLLFGNFGAVASIMVDQAEKFKSLTYSRTLEKEADLEGLALLKERKIDPAGFPALFTRLKSVDDGLALPEFLASHPDIDKRIEYIQKASANCLVADNEQLKIIFEKLKSFK